MKVVILAYDGLEYDLVVKWKLKNIMQEYYGKYEAPISPKRGKPFTPNAWVSFITGLPPEVHGVDDWWSFGKILDWLRFHPPFIWIKGKRMILKKLGIKIKPKVVGKEYIKYDTIFDLVKPSIPLFIPAYNEPVEPHIEYGLALEKGVREYIRTIWKWHNIRKETLFKNLDKDWKLLMIWFDIADVLGHVCIVKCRNELFKAYLDLNSIAKRVRDKLDNETAILIVSDHGMEVTADGVTGDHSKYGFWSLNVKPPLTPKKITDFKNMILSLAKQ